MNLTALRLDLSISLIFGMQIPLDLNRHNGGKLDMYALEGLRDTRGSGRGANFGGQKLAKWWCIMVQKVASAQGAIIVPSLAPLT